MLVETNAFETSAGCRAPGERAPDLFALPTGEQLQHCLVGPRNPTVAVEEGRPGRVTLEQLFQGETLHVLNRVR
jgi:hypothetical protein